MDTKEVRRPCTLHEAIDMLRQCKTTDEIEALLYACGVSGHAGSPTDCPVANWFRQESITDVSRVCVGSMLIVNNDVKFELPDVVTDFIREVDDGGHPSVNLGDVEYEDEDDEEEEDDWDDDLDDDEDDWDDDDDLLDDDLDDEDYDDEL